MHPLSTNGTATITSLVSECFPGLQAIDVFGSQVTGETTADSDVDIALLLTPTEAKQAGSMVPSPLHQSKDRSAIALGCYGVSLAMFWCFSLLFAERSYRFSATAPALL